MKLIPIPAISLIALATTSQGGLILTGIYDGQANTPKGVELYVTSTGSYDGWALELEFNANIGFSTAYTFDSTIYAAGNFLYVTSTPSDPTLSGLGGSIIDDGSFTMNGNDRVRLTDGTNPIDYIGVSGTDGTGSAWEYTDSYGIRNSGTTADGNFNLGDWTFAPTNTLNSGNQPLAAALGTYSPVPEPAAALLGALGLLGLLRRRR